MTLDQLIFFKELIELLCTLILLIITGASAIIALSAYRAQTRSIIITQWTTFKMLLESQEQTYGMLVLKVNQTDDETHDKVLKETIQRMHERKMEIQHEMTVLEKKLGLRN